MKLRPGIAIFVYLGEERPTIDVIGITPNLERQLMGWIAENPELLSLVEHARALAHPEEEP